MSDIPTLPFFFSPKEYMHMIGELHAHRRVIITGGLSEKSLTKAFGELIKLEHHEVAPILILLQSGGGGVHQTFQFVDVINMLNSPVDVLVVGDCASMAVDLVQVCRKRYMLPASRMLLHYIRYSKTWIFDDPDQVENDAQYFREQIRETRERRFSLYENRTGQSRAKLEDLFRYGELHEEYLTAEQALRLNLVDEILTDFKLLPKKQKQE